MRNASQYELAERFMVSQATILRTIAAMQPLIEYALRDLEVGAGDLADDRSLLLDGTLVPCWNFKAERGLYSGKHKRTGFNVQVLADLSGRMLWVSAPSPGSFHDVRALRNLPLADRLDPGLLIADREYIGLGMQTPARQ